jgi:hypothetical protein
MFPGSRLHDEKQDLSTASGDEKEQFSENQAVSVFQNTLFSGIQELCTIRRQEELFSGGNDTQKLPQESFGGSVTQQCFQELLTEDSFRQCPDKKLFQTEHVSKQDFFSEGYNNQDHGIFTEDSVRNVLDENVFSADFVSQKTVPSETHADQTQDEAGVCGSENDHRDAEHMISGSHDIQDIFQSGRITWSMGQSVLSGGQADRQCVFSERHAARQDVLTGDRAAGQEEHTGGRLTQILDIRAGPRQLDMGK